LANAVAAHLAHAAAASCRARGRFCVVFSGGSLINILAPALSADPWRERIDWSSWHVFWADERWVPAGSPDPNSGVARRLLLNRVGIPREHIYAVDDFQSPDETARVYEAEIRTTLQVETGAFPRFDLILLGLGEDGHTASLFPWHTAIQESRCWVVPVFNAPKPPPVRVTMTLRVINSARQVVFVAAGSGKAGILGRVLQPGDEGSELPVRRVNPADGEMRWFVDEQAYPSPLYRNSKDYNDE
jgi:6-phosphogluconolactonase